MRKAKKRAISPSFFFSSPSVFQRFLLSETKKKLDRVGFFLDWSKCQKKTTREEEEKLTRPKTSTLSPLFTHTTHTSTIMFAATQQIASVAGLKATKVQVRAPRSFLCVPALAFENAVSLSLSLSSLPSSKRRAIVDRGDLDFATKIEIRKKIVAGDASVAWRFDGSNVHRSSSRRTKTRTSSRARAIGARG